MPLIVLAAAIAAGFIAMGVFNAVQEAAKLEMGLSDFQLSLVQGLANSIPLALLSIPIGVLVDRVHRIRLMIFLGIVWTIGTLGTVIAQDVSLLMVSRMLAGAGATGALTCAISLASDMCVREQRGRAVLILALGKAAGAALAFGLGGWLFGVLMDGAPDWFPQIAPWRGVHLAVGVLSVILLIPLLTLREPVRREVIAGSNVPFRAVALQLWQRRSFLIPLFAGQVSVAMADAAAIVWAAPVLSRSYGLQPQQFAGWMGLVMFLAGILGAILGGVIADLGQRSGRRGGILLGAVITSAIGIPAALFSISPTLPLFAVALGVLVLAGTITGLVTATVITVLLPNNLRGLCMGLFIAIAGVIGYGVAPTLVAAISSQLGGERHLGSALALVGVVVSAFSFLAFLLAFRNAPASASAAAAED